MLRKYIKDRVSEEKYLKLCRLSWAVKSAGKGRNLDKLGRIFGTDKTLGHHYTQHYMTHFAKFRRKKVRMLEIGVGGYEAPMRGGHSLRMWKRYFPFGRITSIDIHDKSALQERRIRIYRGSQVDEEFMCEVDRKEGPFDLIVDDGSHINEHVIETFRIMFPKLKDGGIYVVEDMQTSYWPEYGGDSNDLRKEGTMMNFFKQLTDSLNSRELIRPGYERSYWDRKIVSMHFYHNMLFIYKGDNDEESNVLVGNRLPSKK